MEAKARILIVDDEPAIRIFLSDELSQAGYEVITAASGEQALAQLEKQDIDVILLDLKMRGMSGLQVMAEVERHLLPPVVILLTAHASLDSAIEAMRRGGHDYLLKPCRTQDLLASVEKGLLRRRKALQQQQLLHQIEVTARQLQAGALPRPVHLTNRPRFLEARGLLLDRDRNTVTRNDQLLPLTPTEFRILCCLMEQPGQIVSYPALMMAIHGDEHASVEEARQALSTHIWRLQKKLGVGPDGRAYIVNVRGRGYKFVGEEV